MAAPKLSTEPFNSAVLTLDAQEVTRLLSPSGSEAARFSVAQKMASAYDAKPLSAQDNTVAEQVFRLLVRDTELSIRIMMAETLKNSPRLPHDIVLTMARDVEEVALPVLTYSEVLSENDLIDLVQKAKETSRLVAIAGRKAVSEKLSDALVDSGNESALSALVENNGATLSAHTLESIMEQHQGNKTIIQALAMREALPLTIAEKLITAVSGKLAKALEEKYRLGQEGLKEEEDQARESATLALIRRHSTADEIERLVMQLITFQRMTPTLLIAALAQGHTAFFERSMAELADVPLANARKLLSDQHLGFRALYNQSKLPEVCFAPLKVIYNAGCRLQSSNEFSKSRPFTEQLIRYIERDTENGMDKDTILRHVLHSATL